MDINNGINWTFLLSFTLFLITVMTTAIKIYGPRTKVDDESLRKSNFLNQMNKDIQLLFEKYNTSNIDNEVKKVELDNLYKIINEMKSDHRKVGTRLDNLLEKFISYIDD